MVFFVGAGPGDKELITVKGMKALSAADSVIYTGSLVNPELLEYVKPGCELRDSSKMTLEQVIEQIRLNEENNRATVRLHTGDPSVYGAVREQMDLLDGLKISYEVIPGVSSFLAAAASLNAEYTLPGVSQTVILTRMEGRTPVPADESIEKLAAVKASMAIFLSADRLNELSEKLTCGGYSADTPAAIVYKASWKEELTARTTVGKLAQAGEKAGITKTALILVGDFLGNNYERSRLYSPDFTHGYREGYRRPQSEIGADSAFKDRAVVVMAFTSRGLNLAEKIKSALHNVRFCASVHSVDNLREFVPTVFKKSNILVFIGAVGIAVRAVSGLIGDKLSDPAVVVVDEKGRYVIPVLSGHFGGANAFAKTLCGLIGAVPVVTTATDINGVFAVDEFAARRGYTVTDPEHVKHISGALLENREVGLFCEFKINGGLPNGIALKHNGDLGILIADTPHNPPFTKTLILSPKRFHIGVGCKRDIAPDALNGFLREVLEECSIPISCVASISSVALKKDEPAIVALAQSLDVDFITYSASELAECRAGFNQSEFVEKITGAGNICETAAYLSSDKGEVVVGKRTRDGICVAVFKQAWEVDFGG